MTADTALSIAPNGNCDQTDHTCSASIGDSGGSVHTVTATYGGAGGPTDTSDVAVSGAVDHFAIDAYDLTRAAPGYSRSRRTRPAAP